MKRPLRVGLLLDDSLDRPDGVQQYVATLGQWLNGQGHEVHYLVGQTARTDLSNVHSMSRNVRARFNQNRLSIPLAASPTKIKQLLAELKLDVLHVQLPCNPLMGSRIIARVSPETAVVGTFHIMPSGMLSKAGTKLLGSLQKNTLNRFDTIFAVSKPAQDFAAQWYHTAVTAVIPNMVDTHLFNVSEIRQKTGSKRIVFLGRLVERKGCVYLLKALTELKKNYDVPAFSVQIGGTGLLEAKLRDFVIHQSLQDCVHFLGFVPDQDKAQFLADADIAVFPSTGGESFGIVLLEAMAAGTGVVIGGNNPGYASVLGTDQPTLFNPKDTTAFSGLLAELLTNQQLTQQIHSEQQERVQQFDVAVVGHSITAAYYSAIAKRKL